MSAEMRTTVEAFINARSEYVQVSRQTVNVDADYYRWQGHMEARRQLATQLGWSVPYEFGDMTSPIGEPPTHSKEPQS